MTFIFKGKRYVGTSAARIVRQMMNDALDYSTEEGRNGKIRDFLRWSLARLADRVHPRELETSERLSDETLAFNYLCLLDENNLGALFDTRQISATERAA